MIKMRKFFATFLSLLLVLTFPVQVLADDIANNVDATVDASVEVLNLTTSSSPSSVSYSVVPQNGDGKNGCNLTGSTILTVDVNNSNPGAATVNSSSLTFTSCGDVKTIIVTPVSAGSTSITLSQSANTTGGTFNLVPAAFDINVTTPPPSDTTPPVITPTVTGTLGDNGWYVSNISVSWSFTDPDSTVTSTTGCGTTNITTDTTGTTLTCSATSSGGTNSNSVTIKRDTTNPTITFSNRTPANSDGWNNTNVTVDWSCSDVTSGPVSSTVSTIVSTEGTNQSALGTCTDMAGNTASDTQNGINIDKTDPTDPTDVHSTSHTVSTPSTINSVDIAWTVSGSIPGATDALSGVDGYSYSFTHGSTDVPDTTKDAEEDATGTNSGPLADGAWYFHLRTFDIADNMTSTVHVGPFIIDTTAPVTTDDVDSAWHNTDVTIHLTCDDGVTGSGCATTYYTTDGTDPTTSSPSGSSVTLSTDGIYTIKYFSVDNAGNAEAVKTAANQVHLDKTAPDVTITTPADSAIYIKNHIVNANWSATDALSGIDTAVGTVASGSAIDTSTLGSHVFTVTATDVAGNTTIKTIHYTVENYTIGFPLPPISIDSKTFKKTSTIPVKIKLTNSVGSPVSDAIANLYVGPGATNPAVSSGGSNVGNLFRYDPTAGQYIFNLSTKLLSAPNTYNLFITLDTGQTLTQSIILK